MARSATASGRTQLCDRLVPESRELALCEPELIARQSDDHASERSRPWERAIVRAEKKQYSNKRNDDQVEPYAAPSERDDASQCGVQCVRRVVHLLSDNSMAT